MASDSIPMAGCSEADGSDDLRGLCWILFAVPRLQTVSPWRVAARRMAATTYEVYVGSCFGLWFNKALTFSSLATFPPSALKGVGLLRCRCRAQVE